MQIPPDELKTAIKRTREQIYQLKERIEEEPNPEEKRRLKRQLKELRQLQFRHLDQIG